MVYSAFVLEHISDPSRYWAKMHEILKPGGAMWALTVDARSAFALLSAFSERLRLKDAYLRAFRGRSGHDRYENYPTHYRANSPRKIRRHARMFARMDFLSMHRVGQIDFYLPRRLRPMAHLADRLIMACGLPGSVLLARLEK